MAAAGALDRGAPELAGRYLERAVAEPPPPELVGELLVSLGWSQVIRGEAFEQAIERIREGIGRVADPARRAQLTITLGQLVARPV
mgnify:CR=1 FL=1